MKRMFPKSITVILLIASLIIQITPAQSQDNCANAIAITTAGVYDVDNDAGDYWYKFTAPKSGPAYVTTGFHSDPGHFLATHNELTNEPNNYKDTKIEIYESCDGEVWMSNDDYYGYFSGVSEINFDTHGLSFVQDNEYFIRFVDSPNGLEPQEGGQYQFELFYEEDIIQGTEETPLTTAIGLNDDHTHLYYTGSQWFSYQLPEDGTYSMELTTYFESPYFQITSENDVDWRYWSDDDENPLMGFTYSGSKDEVVIFSIGTGSPTRNNTFSVSFDPVLGNSCTSPHDLNVNIPVSGNGVYSFEVDVTSGSQYYEYTATQDGWIDMSSCLSGSMTYLKVYTECGVQVFDNDNADCFGSSKYAVEVSIGDSYIFEWDNRNFEGTFESKFYYHESVQGETCDDPVTLQIGGNARDFWFGDQFYTYDVENDGQMRIHTCGLVDDTFIKVYDACEGNVVSDSWFFTCPEDPYADLLQALVEFEVTSGQTLIVEVESGGFSEFDFDFMAEFETVGSSCEYPFDLNATYPIEGDGKQNISVDNTESSQYYKFTADKAGTVKMWSGYANAPGNPDFETDLRVYQSTCDNLIADIDYSPGLLGNCEFSNEVSIGDTYIFEWSNHNWGGQFQVQYYFEEPVAGKDCENPIPLVEGRNDHTSMFYDQYFEYTAPNSGVLELSICGIYDAYYLLYADAGESGLRLLDACEGNTLGSVSQECDPLEDYELFTSTYEIAQGETVIVKSVSRDHYPYYFNIDFTANDQFMEWQGLISSDWFDIDNWSEASLPESDDNVFITASANDPVIVGDAEAMNLTIESGASLTVESGSSLSVFGEVDGDGNAIVKRNTTGSAGYSVVGSPIQNAGFSGLGADYLYSYDGEGFEMPNGQMTVGEGYFAGFNSNSPTITFEGQLNHGIINYELSATEVGEFHLLSNPYASSISFNSFSTPNTDLIGGTVYLWDDGGFNDGATRGGNYVTVSEMGVTGDTDGIWNGNIGSMQGFFVYVEQTGEIVYSPSFQSSDAGDNNDNSYFRETAPNILRLSLFNEKDTDDIIIGLLDGATEDFDTGMDARKLRNPSVSFFSNGAGEELAIQTIPYSDETILDLGMVIAEPALFSLSLDCPDWIKTNYDILLIDNVSNKTHDLLNDQVTIDLEQLESLNRFQLGIIAKPLSNDQPTFFSVKPTVSSIVIGFPGNGWKQVIITTIEGKQIFNQSVRFEQNQAYIEQNLNTNTLYIIRFGGEVMKFVIRK